MENVTTPHNQAQPPHIDRREWLVGLLLFVLAVIPRTVMLGRFVTVDETYGWFVRGATMLTAVSQGDFAGTLVKGHPGVTTMWLGAFGILVEHGLAALGLVDLANADLHRMLMRIPVGVVTALCIALAYPLLRRLLGKHIALLACLFWAADPFLVAHSQLLHTDALLTSFMTLAVLLACVAFRLDQPTAERQAQPRWGYVIAAGVAAGLAVLTKVPALFLFPMTGLIALVAAWQTRRGLARSTEPSPPRPLSPLGRGGKVSPQSMNYRRGFLPSPHLGEGPGVRVLAVILPLVAWALTVVVVWWLVWPAAWVDPLRAVSTMYHEAADNGGVAHEWGSFFFGRPVADPGPAFYPVAVALRLTPWLMVGLVLAVIAALRWRRHLPNRTVLLLLLCYILAFSGGMSLLPKKFDRYLLPIFPALNIIAAVGYVWLGTHLWQRANGQVRGRIVVRVGWAMLIVLLGINLAVYHPYELSYYNPLIGGGAVAQRTVPVGWGEGLDRAGAFIAAQQDCDVPVAASFPELVEPYVCNPVVDLDASGELEQQHYVILDRDQIQRNDAADLTTSLLGKARPVYTVKLHGVEYAYVYDVQPKINNPVDATFGAAFTLRGYEVDPSALRESGSLTVQLQWERTASVSTWPQLFIHILDASGIVVGQVDVPLAGEHAAPDEWQPGHVVTWAQAVPLPANTPAGDYWLALGVYNVNDGQRIPVVGPAPTSGAPQDGAHALILGPLRLDESNSR